MEIIYIVSIMLERTSTSFGRFGRICFWIIIQFKINLHNALLSLWFADFVSRNIFYFQLKIYMGSLYFTVLLKLCTEYAEYDGYRFLMVL